MRPRSSSPSWDFDEALNLLKGDPSSAEDGNATPRPLLTSTLCSNEPLNSTSDLGDFNDIWEFLGTPQNKKSACTKDVLQYRVNDELYEEIDTSHAHRVRWRDELDGADLEDNAAPQQLSSANLRTQKRAARRARARDRNKEILARQALHAAQSDTATDDESGDELESLRRSPDRRSVIQDILNRSRPIARNVISPPSSPSPPKAGLGKVARDFPISNPFLWSAPGVPSSGGRVVIRSQDGWTSIDRKTKLIAALAQGFPEERKYLASSGLVEPVFTPMNVSSIGVHVFVDMSNISIGFHDCLKVKRNIPISVRVRRVPLSFHNFSLILERGRPAAKRVVVGSDKIPSITEAKALGYETNMLERVHKAKELTPRQKKFQARNGNNSTSGLGETSSSETNNGYLSSGTTPQPSKWVEQGVDEILHLKILESVVDAKQPSTIVLATGDAAEAEYSGGFLRMVERALAKGWVVELVSFKLNTSQAYHKAQFRAKWGPLFKWIELDRYAEYMIDEQES